MRRLLIDNLNLVMNAIELDEGSDWTPPEGQMLLPPGTSGRIGDTWDGAQCLPPAPKPPPVPVAVTNGQARVELQRSGYFAAVDAAIQAMGGEALTLWEYGGEIYRASPITETVRAGLGLTPAEMDDLFRRAAGIQL